MVPNLKKALNILLEQEFYQNLSFGSIKLRAQFFLSVMRIAIRFGVTPLCWFKLVEEHFQSLQACHHMAFVGYSRAARALIDQDLQKAIRHLVDLEGTMQNYMLVSNSMKQKQEIRKVRSHIRACLKLLS